MGGGKDIEFRMSIAQDGGVQCERTGAVFNGVAERIVEGKKTDDEEEARRLGRGMRLALAWPNLYTCNPRPLSVPRSLDKAESGGGSYSRGGPILRVQSLGAGYAAIYILFPPVYTHLHHFIQRSLIRKEWTMWCFF